MSEAFNILVVDDDPVAIAVLRRTLGGLGQLRSASSGVEALSLAHDDVPDLVLLDIEMPHMSGFEVCTAMKRDARLHDVPIIFITSHDGIDHEVTGLTLGAADFIAKPVHPALVAARVRTQLTMKAMSDMLRRAATTDPLTKVANRRMFDDALEREWSRARRLCSPLSLLMIDVDHFKAYNDHYGHRAGDHCLQEVAHAMAGAVGRVTDLAARYGGEEFALLLPDTDTGGAATVARRVLHRFEALGLPHTASRVADHVTVSIGIATYVVAPDHAEAAPGRVAADLVVIADQALYAAKHAGRRRACHATFDDRTVDPVVGVPPSGTDVEVL
ncbi:MAG TPA: diguanylate cyclase, partial [Kofleriaceae bacterium]|nr:diguanylate cyclase [Kofleriaceae bacterium]